MERTRRKTDLWAACIGGAIPRDSYLGAIEDTGLHVEEVRENEYEFPTAHALEACDKYGVVSITLVARSNVNRGRCAGRALRRPASADRLWREPTRSGIGSARPDLDETGLQWRRNCRSDRPT